MTLSRPKLKTANTAFMLSISAASGSRVVISPVNPADIARVDATTPDAMLFTLDVITRVERVIPSMTLLAMSWAWIAIVTSAI